MTPEVSRRVAKIMHTDIIYAMSADERIAFTNETGRAKKFSDLPKDIQNKIILAEESLKK